MTTFVHNLFLKDFQLKLFSLVLAILTWIALSYIQQDSIPAAQRGANTHQLTFYNVPVAVLSSASDVHELRVDPKAVEVTVEGSSKTLKTLKSDEIRVLVDLTGLEAGQTVRKRIEVSTPAGVTHVRVVPPDVRVVFPTTP